MRSTAPIRKAPRMMTSTRETSGCVRTSAKKNNTTKSRVVNVLRTETRRKTIPIAKSIPTPIGVRITPHCATSGRRPARIAAEKAALWSKNDRAMRKTNRGAADTAVPTARNRETRASEPVTIIS